MAEDGAAHPMTDKRMKLRYAGTCRICGTDLPASAEAIYERATKTVRCIECPTTSVNAPIADVPPVDDVAPVRAAAPVDSEDALLEAAGGTTGTELETSVAGSSARREYERRKAKDEDRLRQRWGRFGGIAVALSDEKQTTKAWATGAVGEERLGARLDSLASSGIVALHDRRIPGSKANIDHIVVTGAGVWVVDAKRYKGRPELAVEGGLFRPRVEKVVVAGRDCTKLVDGVLKQVEVVRGVVGDVPVTGALCFIEADWPLMGGSFSTRGVHVLWPKRLAKLLTGTAPGGLDVPGTAQLLAERLPPA